MGWHRRVPDLVVRIVDTNSDLWVWAQRQQQRIRREGTRILETIEGSSEPELNEICRFLEPLELR